MTETLLVRRGRRHEQLDAMCSFLSFSLHDDTIYIYVRFPCVSMTGGATCAGAPSSIQGLCARNHNSHNGNVTGRPAGRRQKIAGDLIYRRTS